MIFKRRTEAAQRNYDKYKVWRYRTTLAGWSTIWDSDKNIEH